MPKFIIRFLASRSLRYHLGWALLIGVVLRGLCAYYVYGPMAMDDYLHAVHRALELSEKGATDLIAYRSYLLVWLLTGFLNAGKMLGISEVVDQIRIMYLGLGLISLLAILGGYFYVQCFKEPVFQSLTLYLLSFYCLMPLASTRAFGEAVAMSLLMFGFGICEYGRFRQKMVFFIGGYLFLSFAVLFRFQTGLIFVGYSLILAYLRSFRLFFATILIGLVTLGLEILIDALSQRAALSTLFAYLQETGGGAAHYGVQPWYAPLVLTLACTFFPFSFVLFDKVVSLVRKHGVFATCFLIFMGIHSIIAHKEERFFLPVLPILVIFISALWSEKSESKLVKWVYYPAFGVLNTGLLALICFSNSQASIIEPLVDVQSRYSSGVFVEINSEIPKNFLAVGTFLKPTFLFENADMADVGMDLVSRLLDRFQEAQALTFLAKEDLQARERFMTLHHEKRKQVECDAPRTGASLADRILFKLNPSKNWRRCPSLYMICRKTSYVVP